LKGGPRSGPIPAMLPRGTPGRPKPSEFLSTPARQARRLSAGSASSPLVCQAQSPGEDQVLAQFTSPEAVSNQGLLGLGSSQKGSPAAVVTHSTPGSGGWTPSKIFSTPSRIIDIRTPLRPCSKQRSKEFQDDVRTALEEQSAELLRVALQRRHACPCDHALHEAVRQGNCAAACLLLQNSAEPNDRCHVLERGCEYPLQLALSSTMVRSHDRHQMVELLLQARANVELPRSDAEGSRPLHDAVRRVDVGIVQLLLRHRADPNSQNAFGEAPLELAVRGSHFVELDASLSLIQALLQSGADPAKVSSVGTPREDGGVDEAGSVLAPDIRTLLSRWSAWWRLRMLAWVRSRGTGPLAEIMPDILVRVARFL